MFYSNALSYGCFRSRRALSAFTILVWSGAVCWHVQLLKGKIKTFPNSLSTSLRYKLLKPGSLCSLLYPAHDMSVTIPSNISLRKVYVKFVWSKSVSYIQLMKCTSYMWQSVVFLAPPIKLEYHTAGAQRPHELGILGSKQ